METKSEFWLLSSAVTYPLELELEKKFLMSYSKYKKALSTKHRVSKHNYEEHKK